MSRFLAIPSVALLILASVACSSASFDVTESSGDSATAEVADASTEDSSAAADSSEPADTSMSPDSATAPDTTKADTTTAPDTAKPDVAITPDVVTTPDTAECVVGTTTACECGGTKTCQAGGKWGPCANECMPSPYRFICAYGHDGCTAKDCFDSNNCSAHCDCAGHSGASCSTTELCWSYVCSGYVCP